MKKRQLNVLFHQEIRWKKPVLLTGFMIMISALMIFSAEASSSLGFQQRTVTGKVTDATTGEALPGVTIVIKGTTTGVASDLDGSFTIDVPSGSTILQFTSVGYASQEITVGSRSVIDCKGCPFCTPGACPGGGGNSKLRCTGSGDHGQSQRLLVAQLRQ